MRRTKNSKFTYSTFTTILVALRMGAPLETAALSAHIAPSTLREWMNDNPEIKQDVEEAMANCDMNDLQVIDNATKAGGKDALAAAQWRLERRDPAHWSRGTRNDAWTREQQIKEMVEELRREGLMITEQQVLKDLQLVEKKALPSGKPSK